MHNDTVYTKSAKWKALVDFPISLETSRALIQEYRLLNDFPALEIDAHCYYIDRLILVLDAYTKIGKINLQDFIGFHKMDGWHWECRDQEI